MAISLITKIVVMRLKGQLKGEYERNQRLIAEKQVEIADLKARNQNIKAEWDAIKKDIADPPVEPE